MVTYVENRSKLWQFYVALLRENRLIRAIGGYRLQYQAMASFLRRSWPFCWLEQGTTAVQVGCAEWLLEFGVSQAMIASALVGPSGRVIIIEPDPRNILKIRAYIDEHRVSNITVVEKGAWFERDEQSFTFYEDRTSTNVLSKGDERIVEQGADEAYRTRPKREQTIIVDAVDNVAGDLNVKPSFVNMTINGTEWEAIQGLEGLLKDDIVVSFPIWGPRPWYREAFEFCRHRGYEILVCDAPYTSRAPAQGGRLRFWSQRETPQHFYACAMRPERLASRPAWMHTREVELSRSDEGVFSVSR